MFLYPPRPEEAIAPGVIASYERKGWIAQVKRNGTCSVASVDKNGETKFYTRHGDAHKAWKPTEEARTFFRLFPDSVFVFELLHSKGGGVRDTLYIFDVIKYLGQDLVGKTLKERYSILSGIASISPRISVAKCFDRDLTGLYGSLRDPLDEGIVLKDPHAPLRSCFRPGLNSSWQVKCRVPTKNVGF